MGLFSQGHSTRPDASWLLEERSPYQSYPVLLLSSRGSPLDDPHRVLPLRTSPKLYPDHAAGGRPTCEQILTLLSNVERRMGRLRPMVRRVMMPPSSRVPIDDPTRMPFWRRPVSTFGRFSMTDLDHGRSLAFSLPSSAGPPPEWCSRIVAVVPGASYGGLLLRMSG